MPGHETAAAGPTAAVVGATAAAVAAKVAGFADDAGLHAQAEALEKRLTALAAHDAEVYAAALEQLARPRGEDPERRDFALGQALAQASAAPLAIAEACADVALLAAALAQTGVPELRPDAAAAALIAEGAARAAAHLVDINLAARPGDGDTRRAAAAVAAAAGAAAEAVR